MELNDVFIDCVDKWAEKGLDNRLEEAINRFEDWEKGLEKDESYILSDLLRRFSYYSQGKIQDIIKELSDASIERFGISNQDTIISVVRKRDGKLNSSYEYWLLHRLESGLSKKIYIDSLDEIGEIYWKNIKKVVFVDDCSGTGKQFVKFLKRQKKSLIDKNVILIVIEIMEKAKEYIYDYAKESGININIVFFIEKEKAFKKSKESEKEQFIEMSEKRDIDKNSIIGFDKAEALMAFYNNSPNDTLGMFWFSSEKNNPIFEREIEDEPGWKQINKVKNKRRKQQYAAKVN